ncbi:MAG: endonuclease MutS2 [Anaerolineales bacterium]
MDEKTLVTLEYPKILERLADYCAFPASVEKARALRPTSSLEEAHRRQSVTREVVMLLSTSTNLTIGGARDIREKVELAERGGILLPTDLLDIKYTLISARTLARSFERLEGQVPNLTEITDRLPNPPGLIDTISQTISERGEVLDSASEKLGTIRRDLRITHGRLLDKMQRIVSDPKNAPFLQETLVTQRDGRYVLPLRSEFKGRINSIVHDQSTSGATLFVEPLAVVEMNNQYRELQLAERDEERRVLAALSEEIGDSASELLEMVEVISELDLAFACGKYAQDLEASEPGLRPFLKKPSKRHPGSILRLYQARHPLLDPQTVVPIDVELDQETYVLVITGPNTGGKTVSLKTVGLLALMAQSGLHIPAAHGSECSIFNDIYADIGDEQSIEQSLSTFSSHITNIIRILEQADRQSLVILDELGAGTDPQEGAALARALLTHLLDRGITTLVTTHHPELKAYAHGTPGVVNASVEFDLETLQPTFRLTIGLPGRSNALAIAQRLGMLDEIITDARSEINPDELQTEDLLNEILRQRDLTRATLVEAEKTRREADKLRAELMQRLEGIEDERLNVLEQGQAESTALLDALQNEVAQARRELTRARQPLDVLKPLEDKIEELEDIVTMPVVRKQTGVDEGIFPETLRLGDKVRVRSLNTEGVVTALGEDEAEVQVGNLRVRSRLSELEPKHSQDPATINEQKVPRPAVMPTTSAPRVEPHTSPGMELHLRGLRIDEAMEALENYLDAAYLAGLPFVRIVHGKGTGKLRQAVRAALSMHPQVRSYEPGSDKEGGEGVTVAKLSN